MTRRKTKKAYISDETFAELIESLKQVLAYERGVCAGYRVTRLKVPSRLLNNQKKSIRDKQSTGCSQ